MQLRNAVRCWVFACLAYKISTTAGDTTCEVPSVAKGEATSLTCHFGEDIRITKKNIRIQMKPEFCSSSDIDCVQTTLDCVWKTAEQLNCEAGSGYELSEPVARVVVLKIPEASLRHVGHYKCQALPVDDPDKVKPCYFRLKAFTDDSAAVIIQKLEDNSERLEDLSDRLESTRSTAAAVVVVCVLILVVVVIGGVCLMGRKVFQVYLQRLPCCAHPDERKAHVSVEDVEQPETEELLEQDQPADSGTSTLNTPVQATTDTRVSQPADQHTPDPSAPPQHAASRTATGNRGASGAPATESALPAETASAAGVSGREEGPAVSDVHEARAAPPPGSSVDRAAQGGDENTDESSAMIGQPEGGEDQSQAVGLSPDAGGKKKKAKDEKKRSCRLM